MSRSAKAVATVLVLGMAAAATLLWRDSQGAVPARTFEFTYVTKVPALPEGAQKLRLWIPVPESDAHQDISSLTIASPAGYELHRDPEYRNLYAFVEADPKRPTTPFEVKMTFAVTRREHKVPLASGNGSAHAAEVTPADLERALRPDRLVPTDGMIAALAKQETQGLTDPLAKARAIYDYVVSTMKYDKSGEGWGRGDALYACNIRKGNCTDFHALFIGMMRAAGIPARFEIGFPLPEGKASGEIPGYHCWAVFYLDGVGWVPVDASEAWKNPAKRDYFFGAHDVNRVLFSRGRDIRFNPAQEGEPLNYFVYSYAEVDGKPFKDLKYQFSFRDLPTSAR
ncbi:MAG TPA: transglutaminase domain-containing protein [Candidatus Xenobia bacterium]|nr:transglutaminase domain-containing protein [Candidatus Xenobia bacterium]